MDSPKIDTNIENPSMFKKINNIILSGGASDISFQLWIGGFIALIIVYFSSLFIGYMNKKRTNWNRMKDRCSRDGSVTAIGNSATDVVQDRLVNYYVKTAYNCCSTGNFKNDYVDERGLECAIKKGYRCLDFQIYSLDGIPVIATSSDDSVFMKETFNSIPLSKAMDIVDKKANNPDDCPNHTDPLFLHFRVMSDNEETYDAMGKILLNKLGTKIWNKPDNYGLNDVIEQPLSTLNQKIIIMIDGINGLSTPHYKGTLLEPLVHMSSEKKGLYEKTDIQLSQDVNQGDLLRYNMINMTFCKPGLNNLNTNIEIAKHKAAGTQFIAMNLSNNDGNLKIYENDMFSTKAFKKKDPEIILNEKVITYTKPSGRPLSEPYKVPPGTSDIVAETLGKFGSGYGESANSD